MEQQQALAFCKEWLAAWTGNKPEQLMAYYTDDGFYLDPANKQGLKGTMELLPYFTKLLKGNPNWVWEAIEVIPTEKGFTLKWKATIPVKDTVLTEYGLDIVEIEDNKISRNEVYFDRLAWMKLLQG